MALGGLGMRSVFARGLQNLDEEDIQNLQALDPLGRPSAKEPAPAGSLADQTPQENLVAHLGQGVRAGTLGGATVNTPFARSVVRRGNKLMEAHTYGNGQTRYFERKNPAVLQAAAQRALTRGGASALQTGAVTRIPGQQQAPTLSPRDEELLKLLLGNPTLRR